MLCDTFFIVVLLTFLMPCWLCVSICYASCRVSNCYSGCHVFIVMLDVVFVILGVMFFVMLGITFFIVMLGVVMPNIVKLLLC